MAERRRAGARTKGPASRKAVGNGRKPAASKRPARAIAKREQRLTTPRPPARIRELDPQALCGIGTSVMQLYRVDELPTDAASVHLVFFDRHGWYCEHGPDCPAVAAVRKHTKQTFLTR
jgi:hypothetical protein